MICTVQPQLYATRLTCVPDVYTHIIGSNFDVDGGVLYSDGGSDVLLADCFTDYEVEEGSFAYLTIADEDN